MARYSVESPAMVQYRTLIAAFALATLGSAAGCHSHAKDEKPTEKQIQAERKETASDRVLLDQIPPPAKNRYMAIRTRGDWQNPLLIVGKDTVTLRVMYPPP